MASPLSVWKAFVTFHQIYLPFSVVIQFLIIQSLPYIPKFSIQIDCCWGWLVLTFKTKQARPIFIMRRKYLIGLVCCQHVGSSSLAAICSSSFSVCDPHPQWCTAIWTLAKTWGRPWQSRTRWWPLETLSLQTCACLHKFSMALKAWRIEIQSESTWL